MTKERNGLFVQYCAKDFLDGTYNLDPWAELAYRRIVDMIYTTSDNLADDDKMLAWGTKAGSRWKTIKATLIAAGKIEVTSGRITNARCRAELAKTAEKIAKQSAKGKASAEARKSLKNNDSASTVVEPRLQPRCQPTTELLNQEEERRGEGKPSLGDCPPPEPELFDGVEVVDAEVIEPDPKVVVLSDRKAIFDKQFDEFWAAYPHKVGKQAAIKCYAKARKTASHDTIMHGLANALPAFSRCSEARFIPHPKTWLNEGRWDDVITTNGSSNYGRSGFNDRAERNGFLSLDRTIESCAVRPN